jgi:hypothetical protein
VQHPQVVCQPGIVKVGGPHPLEFEMRGRGLRLNLTFPGLYVVAPRLAIEHGRRGSHPPAHFRMEFEGEHEQQSRWRLGGARRGTDDPRTDVAETVDEPGLEVAEQDTDLRSPRRESSRELLTEDRLMVGGHWRGIVGGLQLPRTRLIDLPGDSTH